MSVSPEQYAAGQAAISAVALDYALSLGRFITRPALSLIDWLRLLHLIYPVIEKQRSASARLARDFYDSQRKLHVPELPRNSVDLVGSDFETFVKNMEPARKRMSQENSPDTALSTFALRSVREVENAARNQIIHAVNEDEQLAEIIEHPSTSRKRDVSQQKKQPETRNKTNQEKVAEQLAQPKKLVRGWARVATGEETCAWCLMLISRGPVYQGADKAGLDLEDLEAMEMIAAGEDVSGFMDQWHDGCDCKVVPVFKLDDWSGKQAADKALDLWNKAAREAIQLIDSGEARTDNRNTETQNVIRRWFYHGVIDPEDYAGFNAA